MINFRNTKDYCCDSIALIENYEKAVNDKKQTWHCHHRLETDLGLTADELMKQNRYFKVPAKELIFLTPHEHASLHTQGEKNPIYGKFGEDAPFYNKHHSEETKKNQSEKMKGENNPMYGKFGKDNPNYGSKRTKETKENLRVCHLGEKNGMYGKEPWNKGISPSEETKQKLRESTSRKRWMKRENEKPIYIDIDLVEYYISLGYHKGRK